MDQEELRCFFVKKKCVRRWNFQVSAGRSAKDLAQLSVALSERAVQKARGYAELESSLGVSDPYNAHPPSPPLLSSGMMGLSNNFVSVKSSSIASSFLLLQFPSPLFSGDERSSYCFAPGAKDEEAQADKAASTEDVMEDDPSGCGCCVLLDVADAIARYNVVEAERGSGTFPGRRCCRDSGWAFRRLKWACHRAAGSAWEKSNLHLLAATPALDDVAPSCCGCARSLAPGAYVQGGVLDVHRGRTRRKDGKTPPCLGSAEAWSSLPLLPAGGCFRCDGALDFM